MPNYEPESENSQTMRRLHEECGRYLRKIVDLQTEVDRLGQLLRTANNERDSLLRRFTRHTSPIEQA